MEKLLAGSEFSLPEDADLELDYYDYNVQNASAVPESYIGMDPAYLVWIPPFSPGTLLLPHHLTLSALSTIQSPCYS